MSSLWNCAFFLFFFGISTYHVHTRVQTNPATLGDKWHGVIRRHLWLLQWGSLCFGFLIPSADLQAKPGSSVESRDILIYLLWHKLPIGTCQIARFVLQKENAASLYYTWKNVVVNIYSFRKNHFSVVLNVRKLGS